ncbi:MAG: right-handed parallel beta-helix repeat-containing protein, partial [Pirellulales bacterium]
GTTVDDAGRIRLREQIILVEASAGPKTEIVGFTIRNGDDGISCHADVRIANNYFTGNDDAIDYEGGGGLCEYNKFEKNTDDAVDYDEDCDATVVHNEIIDNEDDGIEIRLQPYRGKTLQITIRDNVIIGNGEDGIQIIDYPGVSDRRIRIERNVIAKNAMAGIGCMSDAISEEDYRGADIPEPIEVVNNTIVENEYGITGGDNLVAINNIITGSKRLGMKNVDGGSVASHNLFWANGTDFDDASNVRDEHTLLIDPKLGPDYRPRSGSPCVGSGIAHLTTQTGDIDVDPSPTAVATPDLGAFPAGKKAAR